MSHRILLGIVFALLATVSLRAADVFAPPPAQAPAKEYWDECQDYTCKLVTEQKPIKKTVYECREVPFCLHVLPKFGHCECCPECGCVRFKRVLVKKEVIVGYECVTKCVPGPLGKPIPDKGAPQAPVSAPVTDEYYRGVDLSTLPQAVIPAPPVPAPTAQPR
jgi:hypothetical protein